MSELEMIQEAVKTSGLNGFTGNFKPLGGGELNNTYVLELSDEKVILRIAKYADQDSLYREAKALELIDLVHQVPRLIFFDRNEKINNRSWIIEGFIGGLSVDRLNLPQFSDLGELLAKIHQSSKQEDELHVWPKFLEACQSFGNEKYLINHPDGVLQQLIEHARKTLFPAFQEQTSTITQSLIHGDTTPSNLLVEGSSVRLIDWELSSYSDPMAEFSTIYYEDIDYNNGKWRLKIKPEEKRKLFEGYESAGGRIDEARIRFWIIFDKLGAAIFLYWRIHNSGREADAKQLEQYRVDYKNIVNSLEHELLA